MDKYDVCLIGGGLNGLILAIGLDQLGYSVAMVEAFAPRVSEPNFDTRAIALSAGSVAILTAMGLWDQISAYACPIEQVHVSEEGSFGFTRIHPDDLGLDALGQVIEITHLAKCLQAAVPKSVKQFMPATFESIDLTNKTITIQQDDETLTLHSEILLAADGANSPVRKALNLAASSKSFNHSAIVGNIALKRSHDNIAYERFTPQGPVALLPTINNCTTFIWTMPPEEVDAAMALEDSDFLAKLQSHFGYRAGRFEKVSKRRTYPLTQTVMPTPYCEHVLFVGNAAHALHPIAGQGFNLSLRDAAVLFDEIKCHGLGGCIQPYLTAREKDQKRIISLTDMFTHGFGVDLLSAKTIRGAAMHIVERSPLLKKRLGTILAGKAGPLPSLARGFPL